MTTGSSAPRSGADSADPHPRGGRRTEYPSLVQAAIWQAYSLRSFIHRLAEWLL